jgi:glutamate-5-semialdehyde dehydrogenase
MENATEPSADLDRLLARAVACNPALAATDFDRRDRALRSIVAALKENFQDILEANTLDLEASRELGVAEILIHWLKLTPERLHRQIEMLERLGKFAPAYHLAYLGQKLPQGNSYSQVKPVGTIAWIYESLPELAILAAGMTIATGNTAAIYGGIEAWHSHQKIVESIQQGLASAELPADAIQIVPPHGQNLSELVTHNRSISLAIAHGRPALVDRIAHQASVPLLRSTVGNCYLYWGANTNLESVRQAICDSHIGEPEAINAIEKILVHPDRKPTSLTTMWKSLQEKGFELRGDRELVANYGEYLTLAEDSEWRQPYLRKIVAFKMVSGVDEAISIIDSHGSNRSDCIFTDSHQESHLFLNRVRSACIYVNASPRFYRDRQGYNNVCFGMSAVRGSIGLECLVRHQRAIVNN